MSRMVPQVAGKALGKKGLGYGKLVTDWLSIVGTDLGEATSPLKLAFPRGERTGAVLTLEIVPARAVEVQHMLPQLIERVNAVFGYHAVAQIKMVQRPPTRTVRMAGLRPLSVGEEADLMNLTGLLPDGELRDALQNLGRSVQATPKSQTTPKRVS